MHDLLLNEKNIVYLALLSIKKIYLILFLCRLLSKAFLKYVTEIIFE